MDGWMEKIDTDYQERSRKIKAKFFKPSSRDVAPLNNLVSVVF